MGRKTIQGLTGGHAAITRIITMAWVRIDDEFYHHPKVVKAGPLGIAMQVSALCYCNKYLTDGFIPISAIPSLLNLDGIRMRMWSNETFVGGEDAEWKLIVDDLVDAGIWEECIGGYKIHDYLDYQPSRSQVIAERDANIKRQNKWRRNNAVTNAVTDENNGVSNTAPNPNPNPKPLIPDANASGTAAAQTRSASRKEPKEHKAPEPTPEAVNVYRSVARTWPDKATWGQIANTVGDDAARLKFWSEVVSGYIALGWYKRNVAGMLDWFSRGELPHLQRNGNGKDTTDNDDKLTRAERMTRERLANGEH